MTPSENPHPGSVPESGLHSVSLTEEPLCYVKPQLKSSAKLGMPQNCKPKNISSWWFQPIWKICSSKWVHLPQIGLKIKNFLKPPPKIPHGNVFFSFSEDFGLVSWIVFCPVRKLEAWDMPELNRCWNFERTAWHGSWSSWSGGVVAP